MLNKKIKLLILAGVLSTGLASGAMIKSNATSTYPAQKIGDKEYINMVDLGKAIGKDNVKDVEHPIYGKGYNVYVGDKVITLYEKAPYSYINGLPFALDTEKVTDADTGEEFDFPISQSPEKNDKNDLLIPVQAFAKVMDYKVTDKGVEIPDLKKLDQEATEKKTEEKKEASKDVAKVENSNSNTSTSTSTSNKNTNTSSHVDKNTSSRPSTDSNSTNVPKVENKDTSSDAKPEVKPQPKPEVKPEPKPQPKPEVKPQPKPEVKPEPKPQPKPEVKPEPKPEQPSGVSYASFKNSLPGLGFKCVGSNGAGTQYEYGDCGGVLVTGNGAYFRLDENTPAFAGATRSALNMLIPSGAGKAYSLASQGASASFNSDGRHVSVSPGGAGAYIEISN